MAAKKNWLVGCGIGCGVLVLGAIVAAVVGAMVIGKSVEGFDHAVETREKLEAQYGTSDAFRPWPSGEVPAERMEAFLQVREQSHPARLALVESFDGIFSAARNAEELDRKGFFQKIGFVFGMIRKGAGMGSTIGDFFDERNRALLENEMGLGEYTYLYSLAYFGLLGHSPDDSPVTQLRDIDGIEDAQLNINDMDTAMRRVRRDLRGMLESQLTALAPMSDGGDADWYAALEQEIAAMRKQRSRMPWQDGLPDPLAGSFEPYRERLAATYSPTANLFELSRNTRQGMSFTAE